MHCVPTAGRAAPTLENERYDFVHVFELAKSRPGFWLTLMGISAMLMRFFNAVFQLIHNRVLDPTFIYIVLAQTLKLAGDYGSLLVFTQVVKGEFKMWQKVVWGRVEYYTCST